MQHTRYLAAYDEQLRCDVPLSDSDNLPAPEVIAAEIVEDLEAALAQFREILAAIGSEVAVAS